jgi:hypothetical protein
VIGRFVREPLWGVGPSDVPLILTSALLNQVYGLVCHEREADLVNRAAFPAPVPRAGAILLSAAGVAAAGLSPTARRALGGGWPCQTAGDIVVAVVERASPGMTVRVAVPSELVVVVCWAVIGLFCAGAGIAAKGKAASAMASRCLNDFLVGLR